MSVREDRLKAEYKTFIAEFKSRVVRWEIIGSNTPPDRIKFNYELKSLIGFDLNGNALYHTGFEIEIEFPLDYPRASPIVFLTSKKPWPFHPNIWTDGRFCLAGTQHWIPGIGVSLVSVCQMVGEIISYQHVNILSPANGNPTLLDWIHKNLKFEEDRVTVKNPIDPSVIWLPESAPSQKIVFGE